MSIENILEEHLKGKILELEVNGFILSGHNGPYYDFETPVRNTAHWLIIFSYYYEKTENKKYYEAVERCGNYLISKTARPMNSSFYCRFGGNKDFSNGVIGSAWAIEGLVSAYKITKKKKYIEVAEEVFLMHPFNDEDKLWKVINVDGSLRDYDLTFNHQLWFAASGTILLSAKDNLEIRRRCEVFFENLTKIYKVRKNGLIKHHIFLSRNKIEKFKNILKVSRGILIKLRLKKSIIYKENGYHLFNMYAFSLIKEHGYKLDLFESDSFEKSLNYCFGKKLYEWLEEKSIKNDINKMTNLKRDKINIYGYSYNAPGFELPYIFKIFKNKVPDMKSLVEEVEKKQIAYTFDKEKGTFSRNTEDKTTLSARMYEYVRSL